MDTKKTNKNAPGPSDMRLAWLVALERAKATGDREKISRAIGELGKLGLAVSYFEGSEAGEAH